MPLCNSFFHSILLHMNGGLSKILSVHTYWAKYVCTKRFYSCGVSCTFTSSCSKSRKFFFHIKKLNKLCLYAKFQTIFLKSLTIRRFIRDIISDSDVWFDILRTPLMFDKSRTPLLSDD